MVTFHNLGALLGRLAPRCTDPSLLVRRAAIHCIYTLLYIQLRYDGEMVTLAARRLPYHVCGVSLRPVVCLPDRPGFALDYKDESVESLITLREKLNNPDHTVLYRTCSELTKVSPACGFWPFLVLPSSPMQGDGYLF